MRSAAVVLAAQAKAEQFGPHLRVSPISGVQDIFRGAGFVILEGTLGGQAHADPLSALIRQVVNHPTYRRGQVALQLRQLGLTAPGTDFIAYLWQAK